MASVAAATINRLPKISEDAEAEGSRLCRERDEARQALIEYQARVQALFNAAGQGFLLLSPAGVVLETIRSALGYPISEWTGRSAPDLVHPEDRIAAEEMLAYLRLADNNNATVRLRFQDCAGVWRWTEACAENRLSDPAIKALVLAYRDISHHRSLEDQLRHSQKMQLLGTLAAGVAHDFNNLLMIIAGYGHMVLEDLPPEGQLRGRVEEILRASHRGASLTTQLLALSRRGAARPRALDLNHLAGSLERMLQRVIGEPIELVTSFQAEPSTVRVDQGQMEQVILNLALNARDAMSDGGRLAIATSLEPAERDSSPRFFVVLSVSDTGIGMDEDTRRHLFEPYFTTKGEGKGTGLGLSTVQQIVNESGGEISVESQIGRGSIFRVRLPLVSPEPAVAENGATLDRARGGHETVLLVEDDAGVRLLTASILRRSGYRVLEARDGREAIRLWANDAVQVDLLLTDVVMPFVNGPELAAHLKERRPGLPVLYASGYTDDVVAYHGVNQDDTGFLQKPFTAARLIQKVRGTLDRNRCGSTPAAVAG